MSWSVGALVVLALLAVRGPRGRPPSTVVRDRRQGTDPARGSALQQALARMRTARGRPAGTDLALVVTEVAARLRAGAAPGAAWTAALGRPVGPAGPTVADLARAPDDRKAARVVVVAGRLAADLGTPLAPLLDDVARRLAADAEAEGERRAALAGPRATARVLTGLPALGVVLGSAVGADPVAVLLDGATGTGCLAAGVALLLAGRAWTGRLARQAAAAGRPT